MPEVTFIENGELCHATELTLLLTPDTVDAIQHLPDEGDDLAIILWAAIELDRAQCAEECDIE